MHQFQITPDVIKFQTKRFEIKLTVSICFSIGCAIWFASRGRGKLWMRNEDMFYTSPARVLLLGIGADEQVFCLGIFDKAGGNACAGRAIALF